MNREPHSRKDEMDTTRRLMVLAMLLGVIASLFIYDPSTTNAILVVLLFAAIIFGWNVYARWRSRAALRRSEPSD
ncbi:MAG: hypothetical protein QOI31_1777 [Solirubrobacterales bacterium]|jgi:uncharacterized protein (DUF58 family)|nr:hypothetical protein [Solirubrobacterales bacterium]